MAAIVAAAAAKTADAEDTDSGRSTPDYLKKYSVKYHFNNREKTDASSETTDTTSTTTTPATTTTTAATSCAAKRLRTFSETLKMLDDDILAELDVK
jgi:hypothetical protein